MRVMWQSDYAYLEVFGDIPRYFTLGRSCYHLYFLMAIKVIYIYTHIFLFYPEKGKCGCICVSGTCQAWVYLSTHTLTIQLHSKYPPLSLYVYRPVSVSIELSLCLLSCLYVYWCVSVSIELTLKPQRKYRYFWDVGWGPMMSHNATSGLKLEVAVTAPLKR